MSIQRCDRCERFIDTDEHEMYEVGDEVICESCNEKAEMEADQYYQEWVKNQQKSSLAQFIEDTYYE